ncbi:MAG: type 4a pilus biogenesis protein PilO [Paucimonas sp.]|jgi:Tfp pilus assembly protein PilO|nr:type 4a pilus biogenesis protein PilO [Paucimonas sp.]
MNLSFIDDAVDWPALLRWSWLAKGALLGACLLLVPALVYGLQGRGRLEALAALDSRHDALQQQWQARSAQVNSLAAHQEQVARLQADLDQGRRALFDDDGLASLLQSLAGLGAGLSFEQVTALAPQLQSNHVELPLQLRVTGEYRPLKRFLAGLGGSGKLVTVHELNLAAASDQAPGALRLHLLLQAYRALDMQGALEVAGPAAVPPRNPFESMTVLAVAEGAVARDQARLVGHLRDRQGWVALIRVGGAVHALREGDWLGGERVAAIDDGTVELLGATEGAAGITRVLRLAKG